MTNALRFTGFKSQLLKNRNFYTFVTSDFESFISQNLKVVDLLGKKFDFFISLGIQIEKDFHPTNIRMGGGGGVRVLWIEDFGQNWGWIMDF